MTITHRSFLHEHDKQLMIDLACRFQTDHLHVVDLLYRLSSWALDDAENVRLWLDNENPRSRNLKRGFRLENYPTLTAACFMCASTPMKPLRRCCETASCKFIGM